MIKHVTYECIKKQRELHSMSGELMTGRLNCIRNLSTCSFEKKYIVVKSLDHSFCLKAFC